MTVIFGDGFRRAVPPQTYQTSDLIRHLSDRDDPTMANLGRESRPTRFCMALVDAKTGIWYNATTNLGSSHCWSLGLRPIAKGREMR